MGGAVVAVVRPRVSMYARSNIVHISSWFVIIPLAIAARTSSPSWINLKANAVFVSCMLLAPTHIAWNSAFISASLMPVFWLAIIALCCPRYHSSSISWNFSCVGIPFSISDSVFCTVSDELVAKFWIDISM